MFGLVNLDGDPYFEAVLFGVGLMMDALKTYGKQPEGQADVWYGALQDASFPLEDFVWGARAYYGGRYGHEFPTPGQFIENVRKDREDMAREAREREAAERFRREDREKGDARRMEIFGTTRPTREQISEHYGAKFVEEFLEADWSRMMPPEKDPETPEDIARKQDWARNQRLDRAASSAHTSGGGE